MEEELVAPRDDLEQGIAGIWEEVLGVNPIGVQDNFYDLGGIPSWVFVSSPRLKKGLE